MSRLRFINVFPPTGFPDRLQDIGGDPTPLRDAYIRSARSVTWLYEEALRDIEVHGFRSELRVIIRTKQSKDDDLELRVWPEGRHDLPAELAGVSLPPGAQKLDSTERARLMLDAVHAAVLRLAELRGWEPTQFDACREHVLRNEFTYRWNSPWKTAPDRRHRARATFVLDPTDGFGRARLEIAARAHDEVLARSGEAIAYSTQAGFERSVKTMRWRGRIEVGIRPFGYTRAGSGEIVARLDDRRWAFEVTDEVTVRQPTPAMDLAEVPRHEKTPLEISWH